MNFKKQRYVKMLLCLLTLVAVFVSLFYFRLNVMPSFLIIATYCISFFFEESIYLYHGSQKLKNTVQFITWDIAVLCSIIFETKITGISLVNSFHILVCFSIFIVFTNEINGNKKKFDSDDLQTDETEDEEETEDTQNVPENNDYSAEYVLSLIDTLTEYKSTADAGIIFEKIICRILEARHFRNVRQTKASGDQGADIIATHNDEIYAIQCKCYKQNITNKAVQEVYTAKAIYHCQKAIVVTNRYFTNSAKTAGDATGVILIDRDMLYFALQNLQQFDMQSIVKLCGNEYLPENNMAVPPSPVYSKKISQDMFDSYVRKYIGENRERESGTYSDTN